MPENSPLLPGVSSSSVMISVSVSSGSSSSSGTAFSKHFLYASRVMMIMTSNTHTAITISLNELPMAAVLLLRRIMGTR